MYMINHPAQQYHFIPQQMMPMNNGQINTIPNNNNPHLNNPNTIAAYAAANPNSNLMINKVPTISHTHFLSLCLSLTFSILFKVSVLIVYCVSEPFRAFNLTQSISLSQSQYISRGDQLKKIVSKNILFLIFSILISHLD